MQEYEHDPMASDSGDAQKIRQAERRAIRKKKVKSHRLPRFLKHPVFGFGTPVSKMDILHQSLQKQNLNTKETTRSTIYSTIPSTIPLDSPQRPKVQIPAWIAENKATGEKTVRKFNSTTKQTELEGKVNSFDSNIEQIDDFQNLKNTEYEFINQEN